MPFGAELDPGGRIRFRFWAPKHARIHIELQDTSTSTALMQSEVNGWHTLVTDRASAGTAYRFLLPDGMGVPDPASRYQPQDVHGPSEVIDPTSYQWRDQDWRGRPWHEAILY